MSDKIEPIKMSNPCCKNGHCKNNTYSQIVKGFNEGAKQQLEAIKEKYLLIPRWKDGKPIENDKT